jgi:protein TonB
MLEQLVVSSGHRKESRKFRAFFLGTAVLVLVGCFSVFVWSIMAAELTLTDDGLELSAMIAPVPIPAVEPPKPEPPQQQPQREQAASKDEVAHRQSIIQRPDESPLVPDKISTTPMTQKTRPASGLVKIDAGPETDGAYSEGPHTGNGGGGTPGTVPGSGSPIAENIGGDEKPPVMPKKDSEPAKKPAMKSGGVLNGEAKYLPVPIYPAPAKIMHISDSVSVQVVIDEKGNVISAKAVSGHTLLRFAAESAARQAKFSSTFLTGQPVKVTGVIIYKFSNG